MFKPTDGLYQMMPKDKEAVISNDVTWTRDRFTQILRVPLNESQKSAIQGSEIHPREQQAEEYHQGLRYSSVSCARMGDSEVGDIPYQSQISLYNSMKKFEINAENSNPKTDCSLNLWPGFALI